MITSAANISLLLHSITKRKNISTSSSIYKLLFFYFVKKYHSPDESMISNINVLQIALLFIILYTATRVVFCQPSFVVSFQSKADWVHSASTAEWIELSNDMTSTKQFTACKWIKPRYFNIDISVNLWSYCTIETLDATLYCVQMWLESKVESASRNISVYGEIKRRHNYAKYGIAINSFRHRSWAHLCWSLSSIFGVSKFYYNGKLLGIVRIKDTKNQTIIKGVGEVFDAALIFGQEPDLLRGGYDKYQAFFGDLTELNVWDYTLDDIKIEKMANCKDLTKGNVVAWEKTNLKAHNVIVTDIEDARSLCSVRHRLAIFPQKVIYDQAIEVCAIHGGKLALPRSDEENAEIVQIVSKHGNRCIEREESEHASAVWIGATAINRVWHEINSDGSSGNVLNYTNWSNYQANTHGLCAYLQTDGVWQKGKNATCQWYGR